MDSPEDTPPFRQTDSLPNRVGRPGWDWHDDKKALREGIKRVYVIGAGASACAPYGLPTLKTLARNLCNFLDEPERRILVDAIYETLGVDLRVQADGAVDFEELLNGLDPRALQYLSREPVFHSMSELLIEDANKKIRPRDVALSGLREFLLKQCLSLAKTDGPYDRLVCSMTEQDAMVCFNWDVLLELAFRRQGRQFSYWDQPLDTVLLKPHGEHKLVCPVGSRNAPN